MPVCAISVSFFFSFILSLYLSHVTSSLCIHFFSFTLFQLFSHSLSHFVFPRPCLVRLFPGRSCRPQTAGIRLRGESLSCCRPNSCSSTAEWRWRLLPAPPPVHHQGAELTHTLVLTPGQARSALFSVADFFLLFYLAVCFFFSRV